MTNAQIRFDDGFGYEQLRLAGRAATFCQADAMALPFADHVVDVAVMPLVIFFVREPARAVVEMTRVIRHGGIAAYAFDSRSACVRTCRWPRTVELRAGRELMP
jgi:ubiquinone/menaquinone biosynthesis C-methylase UbiE